MEKINWNIKNLWKGCILVSIANAIGVARYPDFSYEHSWDGINYCRNDSSGSRGTISFTDDYCVGVFRNEKTERAYKNFKPALEYLKTAPEKIIELAEKETLQYVLDEIEGKNQPAITTAFWGNANGIFSNDSFDNFLKYGGKLLEIESMDTESAISELIDNYEFSDEEVELLKSVYKRKIINPNDAITLTKKEIAIIGADYDELDIDECETSFKELNIFFK